MNSSKLFDALANIRPNQTKISEVVARFGTPLISDASDGGLFLSFESLGVHVILDGYQRDLTDPVIDEVRLTSPNIEILPCGVHLGQPQADAVNAVRQVYPITDEYEDAVYFRPSTHSNLLASVEFRDSKVVSIELMHQPPFDESWREVIQRRSAELRSGKVTPIPWEEVKRKAREKAGG